MPTPQPAAGAFAPGAGTYRNRGVGSRTRRFTSARTGERAAH